MSSQPARLSANSEKIAERMLQRMSKDQLKKIIDLAIAHSGQAVGNASFEPGDEICPTFHFPFPFPPRFEQFLQESLAMGATTRLFPYGILAPDGVIVQIGAGRVG